MKKIYLSIIASLLFVLCYAQNHQKNTEKVLRLNIINPGIEFEFPIFKKSTIATNIGIGYGGSLKNISGGGDGWVYMIAPFLDIEYRMFYNQKERIKKNKNIKYNSGNYWGARLLVRGKELSSNFYRTDNIDFSIGPVWGIQRAYGKFHFLFDVGPIYYFDTKGNSGFFPFMIQLNIGFNLKRF
jgi:hypothetical protein